MTSVAVELPEKLVWLFDGEARYRVAYGGRGSGKTRGFAKMAAIKAYQFDQMGLSGQILCAREHLNSLDESSMEEVKAAIRDEAWLEPHFEVGESFIRTKSGNVTFAFSGLRRNVDSIKSKARILLCWVDEAEHVSETAWMKLIPTIREEGSEVWVSYNPESPRSATHKRFREQTPDDCRIVEINYRDNPYFPLVLERERLEDKKKRPEIYGHIWEGEFLEHAEGAYYLNEMRACKDEGRIKLVPYEKRVPVVTAWDLGVGDSTAIWCAQFVANEVRLINYYESDGVGLDHYVKWLQDTGYIFGEHVLPHDVRVRELGSGKSRLETLQGLGVQPITIAPQMNVDDGIQAVRSFLDACWFDAEKCEQGLAALRQYRREYNDKMERYNSRPLHDWASHGCLVAGTMVLTRRGDVPVERVRQGDEVWTPVGWAPVAWAGMVKEADEIVSVALSDGSYLQLTPEHKVFTTRGCVPAGALRHNDGVITAKEAECLSLENASMIGYRAAFIESFRATDSGIGRSVAYTPARKAGGFVSYIERLLGTAVARLFRLMGTGTTSIRPTGFSGSETRVAASLTSIPGRSTTAFGTTEPPTADITSVATRHPSSCIGRFGSITTGQSLTGTTSITSAATRLTTALRTLSCFLLPITQSITQPGTHGLVVKQIVGRYSKQARKLPSGTAALRDEGGISSMASSLGSAGSLWQQFARFVVWITRRFTPQGQSIAAKVVRIERIREKCVVYDLTVPHHHCYYANGALVSNSDAFRYLVIGSKHKQRDGWNKPIKRGLKGIA